MPETTCSPCPSCGAEVDTLTWGSSGTTLSPCGCEFGRGELRSLGFYRTITYAAGEEVPEES